MIAEYGECRRPDLNLRGVEQFHFASRGLRWLPSRNQLLEPLVYFRGGDALLPLLLYLHDQIEHFLDTLAGLRGREEKGYEAKVGCLLHCFLLKVRGGLVSLLLQIPLIDDDHETASGLPRQRRDLEILVVQTFDGIDEQHADVGALDRAARAERRIKLDAFLDLRLAAQPGGIDENQL